MDAVWCQVAIAIGQLALLDQHLLGFPWVYDGPLLQYQGRQITISYCLLSPSLDYSVDANCNFALTASAVSLGLSLLWSYIQVSTVLAYACLNALRVGA